MIVDRGESASVFYIVAVVVVIIIGIGAVGFRLGTRTMQHVAIDAGVAKWVVNEQTGVTSFVFVKEAK